MKVWDQFTRRVIIDKPIPEIYRMWATPKGLSTWFLKSATYTDENSEVRGDDEFYQKGDSYRWKWHNWDGSAQGKVHHQNDKNRVEFGFESSVVEVLIEPFIDGRSLVSLIQSQIPEDDDTKLKVYCGCSCGWTFWLTNLKAYMEHGILLNEKGDNLLNQFDGYELVNT
jgi:uncharacterized protein YndB with AHSA1/START domain